AWKDDIFSDIEGKTAFDGYAKNHTTAKVLAIGKNGERADTASEGESVAIVLDRTAFYAESGGQVGDIGEIESDSVVLEVLDTKKQNGKFLHVAKVVSGEVKVGDTVVTRVNKARRDNIRRNHSAVHLLQAALKNTLGNHVAQAGSYVNDERLRFDFSHFSAMTSDELKTVETEVNQKILESISVESFEKNLKAAKEMGAIALFSEKYGNQVRVVQMGDYSTELCGGCHVTNTGKIGLFKIISENGVAAGVRRIEAVTGYGVLNLINEKENTINAVSEILRTNPTDVVSKTESLSNELKECKREIDSLKSKAAKDAVSGIMDNIEEVGGISIITEVLDDGMDMNTMREIGDNLKNKASNAIIVLASKVDDKVNLISMATKEAINNGAHAGKVISEVAKALGGGGGGKPDSAQAGGKNTEKMAEALADVKSHIEKLIKK
ncbi:MAG: DHHA1 domain-containing protein, partial [Oscillospiraceae bacterium]